MRLIACLLLAASLPLQAAVVVTDDSGRQVRLAQPAKRVVATSPHAAELLFAAGGQGRVAGVVKYSDHPAAAARLPQVGDSHQIDIERVLALKPDLLVVWQSGNTARQLEQLRALGIPMFYSEPEELEHIAANIERLGQLMGTGGTARAAAGAFRARIAGLRARHAQRPKVRVFYQVWDQPLYTLGGKQIVNDVIQLCGGVNVFEASAVKAPQVSTEAVLAADPEVVLSGERHNPGDLGALLWKQYPNLLATRRDNLFMLTGERLVRPGPRVAEGAAELCERLEQARQRRL
jgi:iron complex transport system substrate-binding protein